MTHKEVTSEELMARIAALEQKVDRLIEMVGEMHEHVGFVGSLSQTYKEWKDRGESTISFVSKSISDTVSILTG